MTKDIAELANDLSQEWEINWEMFYAGVIEWGAHPHAVSEEGVENIEAWCRRKLGKSGKEAHRMAEAIAWALRHHGVEAQPFIRPALDQIMPRAGPIIAKEGFRGVCDAVVTRANEILDEKGVEDTGALASHVSVRRVR